MPFGFQSATVDSIRAVFARHPEVRQAILYGSRAMGTQRDGSDIDLTLTGKALNIKILSRIETELDDLLLPYEFDLSIHSQISNDSVLNHIERVGILFYDRERGSAGQHQGAAMKKGWQTKKVSEIAKHSLGKMLDKAKNKGEPQPYLRNLNVRWFDFDLSDLLEMPFLPTEVEKYTAVKGDVLICEGGYPGRAAIWDKDEPIYFQKALHRVRFHEPERNRWFLYYLLSKDLDGTLKNHFNGAGIQHFTGEALARFEVPLPPLAEQQRIVGLLDEAFEGLATAKANAEKNLQNARALFESHLQSVFTQRGPGWVEKKLEDIADADCSLSYGIVQPGEEFDEGMPIVRPTDLTTKVIRLSGLKRIDPKLAGGYKRTALQGGELLLCVRGSTGVVSIASPELVGANVTRGIVPIRFNRSLLVPEFGFYLISGGPVQSQIREKTYGTALMQINIRDLRLISLSIPPLKEQKTIAAKLDSLHAETQRLARLYERKLAALEALKKSLLHQAFTGEL